MVSGRALGRSRIAGAALALVALVLPAASAGSRTSPALSVTNLHLSAVWKEGWLTGSIRFSVTVGGATDATATIRPVAPGPLAAKKDYTFTQAGTVTETITLPARLPPRAYVLKVVGSDGEAVEGKFTVPTPPEGIVDSAVVSSAKGGKAVHVLAGAKELWVRFHFMTPPQAKTVKVVWRTPSYTYVGAVTKPYAATIDSFLKSGSPLPHGTWYAILMVDGKTAKKIDVRVT